MVVGSKRNYAFGLRFDHARSRDDLVELMSDLSGIDRDLLEGSRGRSRSAGRWRPANGALHELAWSSRTPGGSSVKFIGEPCPAAGWPSVIVDRARLASAPSLSGRAQAAMTAHTKDNTGLVISNVSAGYGETIVLNTISLSLTPGATLAALASAAARSMFRPATKATLSRTCRRPGVPKHISLREHSASRL